VLGNNITTTNKITIKFWVISVSSISYERLEEIVKAYPANKLDSLNANTKFTIESEDSKGALTIRAKSLPSSTSEFENYYFVYVRVDHAFSEKYFR
jgi:hypothetical protein